MKIGFYVGLSDTYRGQQVHKYSWKLEEWTEIKGCPGKFFAFYVTTAATLQFCKNLFIFVISTPSNVGRQAFNCLNFHQKLFKIAEMNVMKMIGMTSILKSTEAEWNHMMYWCIHKALSPEQNVVLFGTPINPRLVRKASMFIVIVSQRHCCCYCNCGHFLNVSFQCQPTFASSKWTELWQWF